MQSGDALKFTDIEGGEVVPWRERRSGNLQVMRANHLAAHFQFRPETRMAAGLIQVKGLHEQTGQNMLNMTFPAGTAGRVRCTLNAMQQFSCGNCRNNDQRRLELAEESRHVEFTPFVGN